MSKIDYIYQKDPVSSVAQGPCITPKINNKTNSGGITSINDVPKNQEQVVKAPERQPSFPPL